jgi:aspartyl-tRNA(Asn)/glutamyl-tRNA(Gln) amidotransferase subunit B
MDYEAVIGLEVHVQLKTRTKMFTAAPYAYGHAPNTLTDPVVLGLPGALPVLNRKAIEATVKVGMMLGCSIAEVCKWDRKNYFYPDSPKNYQLSQYDQPLCLNGSVEIELPGPSGNVMGPHREVRLTRIHLEEDVGKLTHGAGDSLVDYNRAGTPLIEIVTEPDMHDANEVFAFLTALRNTLLYLGVSECDMEKGQLRCDANISVRPVGQTTLGTKVEIKNLNSITGVRNGVEYEIRRQIKACRTGEKIIQETRRWDAALGVTQSMRGKEMSHDYRYFPDPDLMPVKLDQSLLDRIRGSLPESPFEKQRRFQEQYDLPYSLTSVMIGDQALCAYFEESVQAYAQPQAIANLVVNDLLRELAAASADGESAWSVDRSPIRPAQIADLVKLVDDGVITKQIAREVLSEMFSSGEEALAIIDRKGLRQSNDTGELEKLCAEAVAGNPKAVQEFKSGKTMAINALKGPIMKATRGKANAQLVDEILRRLIDR